MKTTIRATFPKRVLHDVELTKHPKSLDIVWPDEGACEEAGHGNDQTPKALSRLTIPNKGNHHLDAGGEHNRKWMDKSFT